MKLAFALVASLAAFGCGRTPPVPSVALPTVTRSVAFAPAPGTETVIVELKKDGSGSVDGVAFAAGEMWPIERRLADLLNAVQLIPIWKPKPRVHSILLRIDRETPMGLVAPMVTLCVELGAEGVTHKAVVHLQVASPTADAVDVLAKPLSPLDFTVRAATGREVQAFLNVANVPNLPPDPSRAWRMGLSRAAPAEIEEDRLVGTIEDIAATLQKAEPPFQALVFQNVATKLTLQEAAALLDASLALGPNTISIVMPPR